MNRGTQILLALLLLGTSALAGSYQIVYEEQIDGAEQFTDIDPLLNSDMSLAGFIYVDSAGHRLVIDTLGPAGSAALDLDDFPMAVAHRWSTERDSMVIYVIHGCQGYCYEGTKIGRFIVTGDSVSFIDFEPPTSYTCCWESFRRNEIDIAYDGDEPVGVIFECTIQWFWYEMTHGPSGGTESSVMQFDLALQTNSPQYNATSLKSGDLRSESGVELFRYSNYSGYYDHRDGPDDPNWGSWSGTRLALSSFSGGDYWKHTVLDGTTAALFVHDFDEEVPYDEVVYYGYGTDLLGLHGDPHGYAACYNFGSGEPVELWHRELPKAGLYYVYEPQHYIAGMRGTHAMIAVDYRTGMLVDSVNFDRYLKPATYFETPDGLHLVGRSHDTIFVYRFDTPTDTPEDDEPLLPVNYHLAQNYPNPFNPSTTIQFDLPRQAHVTVEVFNVLGQHVTTLADKEYSAGNHSVTWDATDVSSGVYLYRLVTDGYSETRKMVLLK